MATVPEIHARKPRRLHVRCAESAAVYHFPGRSKNRIILIGEDHVASDASRDCPRLLSCSGGFSAATKRSTCTVSQLVNEVLDTQQVVDVFTEVPCVPGRYLDGLSNFADAKKNVVTCRRWCDDGERKRGKKRKTSDGAIPSFFKSVLRHIVSWIRCVTWRSKKGRGGPAETESGSEGDDGGGEGRSSIEEHRELFERFGHDFYATNDVKRRDSPTVQHRFHAVDVRWDPHVLRILMMPTSTYSNERLSFLWLVSFMHRVPTVKSFTSLIRCFLKSESFPSDLAEILGEERARNLVVPGALVDGVCHPIAHQYLKLSQEMRTIVASHVERRISEIEKTLREDVDYDTLALAFGEGTERHSLIRTSSDAAYEASLKDDIRRVKYTAMISSLEIVVRMWMPVLLMDAYAMCRVMRYVFREQREEGTVVLVVVGQVHADHMDRFLREEAKAEQHQRKRRMHSGVVTVDI